jgi:hypothetical protein
MKCYLIILYLISISKCTIEDSQLPVRCLLKTENNEIGSVIFHELDSKRRVLVSGYFGSLSFNSTNKLFVYSGKVDSCTDDAMEQIYFNVTLTMSDTKEHRMLNQILLYTGKFGNACMLKVVDINRDGVKSITNHCGKIISINERLKPQRLQYRNLQVVEGGGGGGGVPHEVFASYSGEVVSETDLAQRNSTDDTSRNLAERKFSSCDRWWCLTDWWIFGKFRKDKGK